MDFITNALLYNFSMFCLFHVSEFHGFSTIFGEDSIKPNISTEITLQVKILALLGIYSTISLSSRSISFPVKLGSQCLSPNAS